MQNGRRNFFFPTMSYSKCICLIFHAIVATSKKVDLLNLVILEVACEPKSVGTPVLEHMGQGSNAQWVAERTTAMIGFFQSNSG